MLVHYLATSPSLFAPIAQNLSIAGLAGPQARIVLEKPLGHSLDSARAINQSIGRVFDESRVFRIDHYLGKETVQNLMALRFANALFEPVWRAAHIDHVQISVNETLGVENRGGYYDHAGAMRDMVQNHLLQLLCLVAMEAPVRFDAEAVRNEKLKVLQALKPISGLDVQDKTVRGQYAAGRIGARRCRRTTSRRTSTTTAIPRPSSRSRPRSRTGAGRACRSTCAPASAWRASARKSSSSSSRCRTA